MFRMISLIINLQVKLEKEKLFTSVHHGMMLWLQIWVGGFWS